MKCIEQNMSVIISWHFESNGSFFVQTIDFLVSQKHWQKENVFSFGVLPFHHTIIYGINFFCDIEINTKINNYSVI